MSFATRMVDLDHCSVVAVDGDLDLGTADELWATLAGALARREVPLVLDLAGLAFCDSAGLAVFVRAHNLLSGRGQRLAVARTTPAVQRVLELSGVSGTIASTRDLDEAYAAVAA